MRLAAILLAMLLPMLLPLPASTFSPPLASRLSPLLSPRPSSLLALRVSSLLGPTLSPMLASRLSSLLASVLSSLLGPRLLPLLASMLSSRLSSLLGWKLSSTLSWMTLSWMLSWILAWILAAMRRRPQNTRLRRRGPRPPRAESVARTPDPDKSPCTQMHGREIWFRCARARTVRSSGFPPRTPALQVDPVSGCQRFRIFINRALWLNVGFAPKSDLIAAGSRKRRDVPQAAVTSSCSDIA